MLLSRAAAQLHTKACLSASLSTVNRATMFFPGECSMGISVHTPCNTHQHSSSGDQTVKKRRKKGQREKERKRVRLVFGFGNGRVTEAALAQRSALHNPPWIIA